MRRARLITVTRSARRSRRPGRAGRGGLLLAGVALGGTLLPLGAGASARSSGTLALVAGVTHTPAAGPATGSNDLANPSGVAVDPTTGNVYIADTGDNVIEMVTPAGVQSIVAGIPGVSGAPTPGPADASELDGPSGLAFDPTTGNLYIADSNNNDVESVSPTGVLSVVAGTGTAGTPTPGPASASELSFPSGVAVDSANGNLFIADTGNNVVEQVTPAGVLSIVAGTGSPGAPSATAADLNSPSGVAVDPTTGNLYISDTVNSLIEEVTPSGGFSIIAGNGKAGSAVPGIPTDTSLSDPSGLAFDPATGDLYIADTGNSEIEELNTTGLLLLVVTSGLSSASGVAVDPLTGTLYVADTGDDLVDQVGGSGSLSVIAGGAGSGVPSPEGPATASPLSSPDGVAVDPADGDTFIADTGNNVIEEVSPSGQLSIVAGTGASGAPTPGPADSSDLAGPSGVAVDPTTGDLYIADSSNNEIEEVTPSGKLSVIAGNGTLSAPTPGPATASELDDPTGVAVDPANGDVYIADSLNSLVEQVTPAGKLSVIAGNGTLGAPTPGPATASELDDPTGVAVDPANGDVYIADSLNNVVEQVTPAGKLSIVAGDGFDGTPTPGPATSSDLGSISGVAVNSSSGVLYIADTTNDVVEAVNPGGQLSIVAGSGLQSSSLSPTPGPATASELDTPYGLAVDPSNGELLIADTGNSDLESVSFS